jgi:subtilisin family serine protease
MKHQPSTEFPPSVSVADHVPASSANAASNAAVRGPAPVARAFRPEGLDPTEPTSQRQPPPNPQRPTRIAIIDSGVNLAHPHIGNIAGGVTIASSTTDPTYIDRLGHGTAVAALIHDRAPQAQLLAVKVFHDALVTNLPTLLSAIDWCLAHDIDLINLSLGTTNQNHRGAFEAAIARVQAKGKALISAAEMQNQPALPGILPGVIAVLADNSKEAGEFGIKTLHGKNVFTASPYPREIPNVPRESNLHGISFAVAHITATIANLWNPNSSRNAESLLLQPSTHPVALPFEG